MVDRQDIDALLVGALYGELTPAEEARLHAHLESHPADRSALDDLKSARAAVRESRVFDLQPEPPQAVSALLLQEAHRRAPRRAPEEHAKESWLARLARSFVVHPAMAAAATLVLVVGVAGGLYLHNGGDKLDRRAPAADNGDGKDTTAAVPAAMDHRAGDQLEAETTRASNGMAAAGSAAPAPDPTGNQAANGESYGVTLADKNLSKQEAQAIVPAVAASPAPTAPKPTMHTSRGDGIVVSRSEPKPKDLDRGKTFKGGDDGEFSRDVGAAGGGGHASSGMAYGPSSNGAPAGGAPPPPPPAPSPAPQQAAAAPTATPSAPRERKGADADEDAPTTKEASKVAEDEKWAADQYKVALGYVNKNDCDNAANVAFGIRAKAPGYYAQNVGENRDIKKCISYVNQLTEKRAASVSKKAAAAPAKAKAAPPPAAAADEKPANATAK